MGRERGSHRGADACTYRHASADDRLWGVSGQLEATSASTTMVVCDRTGEQTEAFQSLLFT